MTSFILIPGAGGIAWYWHRLTPLLEAAGHEAIPVDLPGDDAKAGLRDYADIVVAAIGARADVVLVAQSLGGFTAPLVCERARVSRLVFVNAMIPLPGERVGAWGEATGSGAAGTAGATQRLKPAAAGAPNTTNAIRPLHVFRGFHGSVRSGRHLPASVAMPSPNAITPHAAATMSSRWRNTRTSSRIDNG